MSIVYNFDYGSEFEIAICSLLRRMLPSRYGICRGFAVDKDGNTAGDDIIIYDTFRFPTLRFLNRDNEFARKNQIPIDAVYAYIEAKHTLDSKTLPTAIDQVRKFKRLCYSRLHQIDKAAEAYFNRNQNTNNIHIFNNEYSKERNWNPIVTTPVYSMIISKNCVGTNGEKTTTYQSARDFLSNSINDYYTIHPTERDDIYNPDSFIAGNMATAFCGYQRQPSDDDSSAPIQITRFFAGISPNTRYQVDDTGERSFGLAIAHLMMALDFIHLNPMPWDRIFNTAKIPDRELRDGVLSSL